MMIRDLYRSEAKAIKTFGKNNWRFLEATTEASRLPSVTPTRETIYNEQLRQVKNLYPSNTQLSEFINAVNIDQNKIFTYEANDNYMFEKTIEIIEEALGMWGAGGSKGSAGIIKTKISKEDTAASLQKYQLMLQNLQNLYNTLSTSTDSYILSNLKSVKAAIAELESDIRSHGQGTLSRTLSEANSGGYVDKAIWLGWALKGRYLETAATEWFAERIPENIEVVDTGKVYGMSYDIFGAAKSAGKQLKSDILAFDMTKNIQVTYKIDDKLIGPVPLEKFLKDVKSKSGTHTISIDNNNYNELQKAIVFGAQAKSGRNQAMFNKASTQTTLQDIVNNSYAIHRFGRALQILIRAATDSKHKTNLIVQQPMYNAMFNYLLAYHLRYIIGAENSLIVTRDGIYTVYEYMRHQWETARRIVQAAVSVNLSQPGKIIPIEYSARGHKDAEQS